MSSPFQDQLKTDLDNIFLNTDEFADMHTVNGIENIPCIIDSDATQSLRPGLGKYDGTFKETIMLFIKESDVPETPIYNQILNLDKHKYRIMQVNLCNSLYEISLEAIK